jgi:hypothetical protein
MPNTVAFDGVPDAWFWSHAPKFGFAAVISGERCSSATATPRTTRAWPAPSWTSAVPTTTSWSLPEQPLVVVEGFTHKGFAFDTVVAVSPSIHKYHADTPDVHEATRAVFPAYRCEFSGAETEDEAVFRYSRAAGAQPTRWHREPNPYLRMRAAPGHQIPDLGFANPTKLVHELTQLPDRPDGFVEFENYERRLWTVQLADGYTVTEGDTEPSTMELPDLVELTKSSCTAQTATRANPPSAELLPRAQPGMRGVADVVSSRAAMSTA